MLHDHRRKGIDSLTCQLLRLAIAIHHNEFQLLASLGVLSTANELLQGLPLTQSFPGMRAPSGLKENQSRRVRIRNIQLGTRGILDVRRRLESAELVVSQNKQDHERDRSSNGSNHYSEATFARRRATLRSWLCHERFCFWIWFHATSSLWRSGSNGRGTTANHWLRNLRTGRPATTTGDFEVGIHCVPLVNRILVSHAGIAS